jgi:hypothetical protein
LVGYSWINGGGLWSVDAGLTNPKDNPFAYEGLPTSFPHYKAIAAFEARLARVRGQAQTKGFLNTGLRLRDLELLQPSPMPTVNVVLLPVEPLGVTSETEAMPALLTSVWKKADDSGQTDEVAVAMVNHSSQNLTNVSFTFDPASYGMCSSPADCSQATFKVYETDMDNPASESLILTFSGTLTTSLPGGVPSEDARFFRVVRQP